MSVEAATRSGPDPEALLRRWRESGDAAALGELFDATAPELFGVALHLCRDPARAEDALQETYLAALASLHRFEEGRRVVPWLVGILRNKLHEVRRFEARTPEPARAPRPGAAPDPALEAATAEEEERVHRALADLPEPYREVALLRWRHGLEPAEIAELKRMSPGTVRSLLHRALERLRRAFVALPSLLFGAHGEVAPRGLGGVRAAVLAEAPAAAAVVPVVLLGGIVMAKKTVVAAAAAALLLAAGFGAWKVAQPGGGDGDAKPAGPTTAATTAPPAPVSAPPAPVSPDTAPPIAAETIPPPVDLSKCDRDLDLFGIVVDSKDAPVPGARLSLFEYPLRRGGILVDGLGHWKEKPGPSCLSSTDGSFAFRLGRGHLTHLRATKSGLAETVLSDCQAGERIKVAMAAAGRLVVKARDEAGKPVSGVRLQLASSWKVYFTRLERRGVTDSTGSCVFEDLPPGPVALREIEHERLSLNDHPRTEIPVAGEAVAEIVLREGRTVRGSVADAETGKPIAGARIGAYWVLSRPVLSGADGSFEVRGWLGDGADLHVVAEGWGRDSAIVPAEGDVEFRLHRGDEAIGRCLGADGKPVSDAVVCAMGSIRESQRQELDTVTTATAADGRFRLTALRRDMPHALVVMAPGHGRFLLDFRPRADGPGVVDFGDLILPPARRIEGRVLGVDGAPVADARVELDGANADRGRLIAKDDRVDIPRYGNQEIRRTDDLGRFRFPDLAPGRYSVTATVEGVSELRAPADLTAKDAIDLELRAPAAGEGHTLVVQLVDGAGSPVPGIRINANQGRGKAQRNSGPDGTARFEGLKPGYVSINAWDVDPREGMRYLGAQTHAQLPVTEPLRIVLLPRSEISGTVVGPEGKPIGGFMVCASDPAGGPERKWFGQVNAEGQFRIEAPPGVTLTVLLPDARTGGGATPYRGQVEGVVAPATGVILRARALRTDNSLVVELRDADGGPVGEGHLMIIAGGRPKQPAFDAAGRIEMRDLSEDPFHAMIQAPREPVHRAWTEQVLPAPRDIVPGAEETVVFRFRRGVPLRGRVVDEKGSAVAGAMVSVQTMDYASRWILSGDDGTFDAIVLPGERLRHLAAEKRFPDGSVLRVEHKEFDLPKDELVLRVVPWKDPSGR